MFTDLPSYFSLLFYIYDLCFIIEWSNLSFLICGHGFIFIPPLIKASLYDASAKMAVGNRNEVLFEANKSRLLALYKKLFILNSFGINLNPIQYVCNFFSSNALNKEYIIYVNSIYKKLIFHFFTVWLGGF